MSRHPHHTNNSQPISPTSFHTLHSPQSAVFSNDSPQPNLSHPALDCTQSQHAISTHGKSYTSDFEHIAANPHLSTFDLSNLYRAIDGLRNSQKQREEAENAKQFEKSSKSSSIKSTPDYHKCENRKCPLNHINCRNSCKYKQKTSKKTSQLSNHTFSPQKQHLNVTPLPSPKITSQNFIKPPTSQTLSDAKQNIKLSHSSLPHQPSNSPTQHYNNPVQHSKECPTHQEIIYNDILANIVDLVKKQLILAKTAEISPTKDTQGENVPQFFKIKRWGVKLNYSGSRRAMKRRLRNEIHRFFALYGKFHGDNPYVDPPQSEESENPCNDPHKSGKFDHTHFLNIPDSFEIHTQPDELQKIAKRERISKIQKLIEKYDKTTTTFKTSDTSNNDKKMEKSQKKRTKKDPFNHLPPEYHTCQLSDLENHKGRLPPNSHLGGVLIDPEYVYQYFYRYEVPGEKSENLSIHFGDISEMFDDLAFVDDFFSFQREKETKDFFDTPCEDDNERLLCDFYAASNPKDTHSTDQIHQNENNDQIDEFLGIIAEDDPFQPHNFLQYLYGDDDYFGYFDALREAPSHVTSITPFQDKAKKTPKNDSHSDDDELDIDLQTYYADIDFCDLGPLKTGNGEVRYEDEYYGTFQVYPRSQDPSANCLFEPVDIDEIDFSDNDTDFYDNGLEYPLTENYKNESDLENFSDEENVDTTSLHQRMLPDLMLSDSNLPSNKTITKLLNSLLRCGYRINHQALDNPLGGATLLHWFVQHSHPIGIQFCLEHNADPSLPHLSTGHSAFVVALSVPQYSRYSTECLILLLSYSHYIPSYITLLQTVLFNPDILSLWHYEKIKALLTHLYASTTIKQHLSLPSHLESSYSAAFVDKTSQFGTDTSTSTPSSSPLEIHPNDYKLLEQCAIAVIHALQNRPTALIDKCGSRDWVQRWYQSQEDDDPEDILVEPPNNTSLNHPNASAEIRFSSQHTLKPKPFRLGWFYENVNYHVGIQELVLSCCYRDIFFNIDSQIPEHLLLKNNPHVTSYFIGEYQPPVVPNFSKYNRPNETHSHHSQSVDYINTFNREGSQYLSTPPDPSLLNSPTTSTFNNGLLYQETPKSFLAYGHMAAAAQHNDNYCGFSQSTRWFFDSVLPTQQIMEMREVHRQLHHEFTELKNQYNSHNTRGSNQEQDESVVSRSNTHEHPSSFPSSTLSNFFSPFNLSYSKSKNDRKSRNSKEYSHESSESDTHLHAGSTTQHCDSSEDWSDPGYNYGNYENSFVQTSHKSKNFLKKLAYYVHPNNPQDGRNHWFSQKSLVFLTQDLSFGGIGALDKQVPPLPPIDEEHRVQINNDPVRAAMFIPVYERFLLLRLRWTLLARNPSYAEVESLLGNISPYMISWLNYFERTINVSFHPFHTNIGGYINPIELLLRCSYPYTETTSKLLDLLIFRGFALPLISPTTKSISGNLPTKNRALFVTPYHLVLPLLHSEQPANGLISVKNSLYDIPLVFIRALRLQCEQYYQYISSVNTTRHLKHQDIARQFKEQSLPVPETQKNLTNELSWATIDIPDHLTLSCPHFTFGGDEFHIYHQDLAQLEPMQEQLNEIDDMEQSLLDNLENDYKDMQLHHLKISDAHGFPLTESLSEKIAKNEHNTLLSEQRQQILEHRVLELFYNSEDYPIYCEEQRIKRKKRWATAIHRIQSRSNVISPLYYGKVEGLDHLLNEDDEDLFEPLDFDESGELRTHAHITPHIEAADVPKKYWDIVYREEREGLLYSDEQPVKIDQAHLQSTFNPTTREDLLPDCNYDLDYIDIPLPADENELALKLEQLMDFAEGELFDYGELEGDLFDFSDFFKSDFDFLSTTVSNDDVYPYIRPKTEKQYDLALAEHEIYEYELACELHNNITALNQDELLDEYGDLDLLDAEIDKIDAEISNLTTLPSLGISPCTVRPQLEFSPEIKALIKSTSLEIIQKRPNSRKIIRSMSLLPEEIRLRFVTYNVPMAPRVYYQRMAMINRIFLPELTTNSLSTIDAEKLRRAQILSTHTKQEIPAVSKDESAPTLSLPSLRTNDLSAGLLRSSSFLREFTLFLHATGLVRNGLELDNAELNEHFNQFSNIFTHLSLMVFPFELYQRHSHYGISFLNKLHQCASEEQFHHQHYLTLNHIVSHAQDTYIDGNSTFSFGKRTCDKNNLSHDDLLCQEEEMELLNFVENHKYVEYGDNIIIPSLTCATASAYFVSLLELMLTAYCSKRAPKPELLNSQFTANVQFEQSLYGGQTEYPEKKIRDDRNHKKSGDFNHSTDLKHRLSNGSVSGRRSAGNHVSFHEIPKFDYDDELDINSASSRVNLGLIQPTARFIVPLEFIIHFVGIAYHCSTLHKYFRTRILDHSPQAQIERDEKRRKLQTRHNFEIISFYSTNMSSINSSSYHVGSYDSENEEECLRARQITQINSSHYKSSNIPIPTNYFRTKVEATPEIPLEDELPPRMPPFAPFLLDVVKFYPLLPWMVLSERFVSAQASTIINLVPIDPDVDLQVPFTQRMQCDKYPAYKFKFIYEYYLDYLVTIPTLLMDIWPEVSNPDPHNDAKRSYKEKCDVFIRERQRSKMQGQYNLLNPVTFPGSLKIPSGTGSISGINPSQTQIQLQNVQNQQKWLFSLLFAFFINDHLDQPSIMTYIIILFFGMHGDNGGAGVCSKNQYRQLSFYTHPESTSDPDSNPKVKMEHVSPSLLGSKNQSEFIFCAPSQMWDAPTNSLIDTPSSKFPQAFDWFIQMFKSPSAWMSQLVAYKLTLFVNFLFPITITDLSQYRRDSATKLAAIAHTADESFKAHYYNHTKAHGQLQTSVQDYIAQCRAESSVLLSTGYDHMGALNIDSWQAVFDYQILLDQVTADAEYFAQRDQQLIQLWTDPLLQLNDQGELFIADEDCQKFYESMLLFQNPQLLDPALHIDLKQYFPNCIIPREFLHYISPRDTTIVDLNGTRTSSLKLRNRSNYTYHFSNKCKPYITTLDQLEMDLLQRSSLSAGVVKQFPYQRRMLALPVKFQEYTQYISQLYTSILHFCPWDKPCLAYLFAYLQIKGSVSCFLLDSRASFHFITQLLSTHHHNVPGVTAKAPTISTHISNPTPVGVILRHPKSFNGAVSFFGVWLLSNMLLLLKHRFNIALPNLPRNLLTTVLLLALFGPNTNTQSVQYDPTQQLLNVSDTTGGLPFNAEYLYQNNYFYNGIHMASTPYIQALSYKSKKAIPCGESNHSAQLLQGGCFSSWKHEFRQLVIIHLSMLIQMIRTDRARHMTELLRGDLQYLKMPPQNQLNENIGFLNGTFSLLLPIDVLIQQYANTYYPTATYSHSDSDRAIVYKTSEPEIIQPRELIILPHTTNNERLAFVLDFIQSVLQFYSPYLEYAPETTRRQPSSILPNYVHFYTPLPAFHGVPPSPTTLTDLSEAMDFPSIGEREHLRNFIQLLVLHGSSPTSGTPFIPLPQDKVNLHSLSHLHTLTISQHNYSVLHKLLLWLLSLLPYDIHSSWTTSVLTGDAIICSRCHHNRHSVCGPAPAPRHPPCKHNCCDTQRPRMNLAQSYTNDQPAQQQSILLPEALGYNPMSEHDVPIEDYLNDSLLYNNTAVTCPSCELHHKYSSIGDKYLQTFINLAVLTQRMYKIALYFSPANYNPKPMPMHDKHNYLYYATAFKEQLHALQHPVRLTTLSGLFRFPSSKLKFTLISQLLQAELINLHEKPPQHLLYDIFPNQRVANGVGNGFTNNLSSSNINNTTSNMVEFESKVGDWFMTLSFSTMDLSTSILNSSSSLGIARAINNCIQRVPLQQRGCICALISRAWFGKKSSCGNHAPQKRLDDHILQPQFQSQQDYTKDVFPFTSPSNATTTINSPSTSPQTRHGNNIHPTSKHSFMPSLSLSTSCDSFEPPFVPPVNLHSSSRHDNNLITLKDSETSFRHAHHENARTSSQPLFPHLGRDGASSSIANYGTPCPISGRGRGKHPPIRPPSQTSSLSYAPSVESKSSSGSDISSMGLPPTPIVKLNTLHPRQSSIKQNQRSHRHPSPNTDTNSRELSVSRLASVQSPRGISSQRLHTETLIKPSIDHTMKVYENSTESAYHENDNSFETFSDDANYHNNGPEFAQSIDNLVKKKEQSLISPSMVFQEYKCPCSYCNDSNKQASFLHNLHYLTYNTINLQIQQQLLQQLSSSNHTSQSDVLLDFLTLSAPEQLYITYPTTNMLSHEKPTLTWTIHDCDTLILLLSTHHKQMKTTHVQNRDNCYLNFSRALSLLLLSPTHNNESKHNMICSLLTASTYETSIKLSIANSAKTPTKSSQNNNLSVHNKHIYDFFSPIYQQLMSLPTNLIEPGCSEYFSTDNPALNHINIWNELSPHRQHNQYWYHSFTKLLHYPVGLSEHTFSATKLVARRDLFLSSHTVYNLFLLPSLIAPRQIARLGLGNSSSGNLANNNNLNIDHPATSWDIAMIFQLLAIGIRFVPPQTQRDKTSVNPLLQFTTHYMSPGTPPSQFKFIPCSSSSAHDSDTLEHSEQPDPIDGFIRVPGETGHSSNQSIGSNHSIKGPTIAETLCLIHPAVADVFPNNNKEVFLHYPLEPPQVPTPSIESILSDLFPSVNSPQRLRLVSSLTASIQFIESFNLPVNNCYTSVVQMLSQHPDPLIRKTLFKKEECVSADLLTYAHMSLDDLNKHHQHSMNSIFIPPLLANYQGNNYADINSLEVAPSFPNAIFLQPTTRRLGIQLLSKAIALKYTHIHDSVVGHNTLRKGSPNPSSNTNNNNSVLGSSSKSVSFSSTKQSIHGPIIETRHTPVEFPTSSLTSLNGTIYATSSQSSSFIDNCTANSIHIAPFPTSDPFGSKNIILEPESSSSLGDSTRVTGGNIKLGTSGSGVRADSAMFDHSSKSTTSTSPQSNNPTVSTPSRQFRLNLSIVEASSTPCYSYVRSFITEKVDLFSILKEYNASADYDSYIKSIRSSTPSSSVHTSLNVVNAPQMKTKNGGGSIPSSSQMDVSSEFPSYNLTTKIISPQDVLFVRKRYSNRLLWMILNSISQPNIKDIEYILYDQTSHYDGCPIPQKYLEGGCQPLPLKLFEEKPYHCQCLNYYHSDNNSIVGETVLMHAVLRRWSSDLLILLMNFCSPSYLVTTEDLYGRTLVDYLFCCATATYAPAAVQHYFSLQRLYETQQPLKTTHNMAKNAIDIWDTKNIAKNAIDIWDTNNIKFTQSTPQTPTSGSSSPQNTTITTTTSSIPSPIQVRRSAFNPNHEMVLWDKFQSQPTIQSVGNEVFDAVHIQLPPDWDPSKEDDIPIFHSTPSCSQSNNNHSTQYSGPAMSTQSDSYRCSGNYTNHITISRELSFSNSSADSYADPYFDPSILSSNTPSDTYQFHPGSSTNEYYEPMNKVHNISSSTLKSTAPSSRADIWDRGNVDECALEALRLQEQQAENELLAAERAQREKQVKSLRAADIWDTFVDYNNLHLQEAKEKKEALNNLYSTLTVSTQDVIEKENMRKRAVEQIYGAEAQSHQTATQKFAHSMNMFAKPMQMPAKRDRKQRKQSSDDFSTDSEYDDDDDNDDDDECSQYSSDYDEDESDSTLRHKHQDFVAQTDAVTHRGHNNHDQTSIDFSLESLCSCCYNTANNARQLLHDMMVPANVTAPPSKKKFATAVETPNNPFMNTYLTHCRQVVSSFVDDNPPPDAQLSIHSTNPYFGAQSSIGSQTEASQPRKSEKITHELQFLEYLQLNRHALSFEFDFDSFAPGLSAKSFLVSANKIKPTLDNCLHDSLLVLALSSNDFKNQSQSFDDLIHPIRNNVRGLAHIEALIEKYRRFPPTLPDLDKTDSNSHETTTRQERHEQRLLKRSKLNSPELEINEADIAFEDGFQLLSRGSLSLSRSRSISKKKRAKIKTLQGAEDSRGYYGDNDSSYSSVGLSSEDEPHTYPHNTELLEQLPPMHTVLPTNIALSVSETDDVDSDKSDCDCGYDHYLDPLFAEEESLMTSFIDRFSPEISLPEDYDPHTRPPLYTFLNSGLGNQEHPLQASKSGDGRCKTENETFLKSVVRPEEHNENSLLMDYSKLAQEPFIHSESQTIVALREVSHLNKCSTDSRRQDTPVYNHSDTTTLTFSRTRSQSNSRSGISDGLSQHSGGNPSDAVYQPAILSHHSQIYLCSPHSATTALSQASVKSCTSNSDWEPQLILAKHSKTGENLSARSAAESSNVMTTASMAASSTVVNSVHQAERPKKIPVYQQFGAHGPQISRQMHHMKLTERIMSLPDKQHKVSCIYSPKNMGKTLVQLRKELDLQRYYIKQQFTLAHMHMTTQKYQSSRLYEVQQYQNKQNERFAAHFTTVTNLVTAFVNKTNQDAGPLEKKKDKGLGKVFAIFSPLLSNSRSLKPSNPQNPLSPEQISISIQNSSTPRPTSQPEPPQSAQLSTPTPQNTSGTGKRTSRLPWKK